MPLLSRREFAESALAVGAQSAFAFNASGIDQVLRSGAERHGIPAVAAMVATPDSATYTGACGRCTADSIFRIASMTKAITSVAALQLVEQKKLQLETPVSQHLPEFRSPQILEGFAADSGKPILRPATRPVTLRRLLTHTSGLAYDNWNADLLRYAAQTPAGDVPPLMTEPGTRWEYGTSLDWTGRLVERVSGLSLEEYFQRHIFQPLGMTDTSFILPSNKFDRLVDSWQRQSDGNLELVPRKQPQPPKAFNGGGGLYSTAADYVRFMQAILRNGQGQTGARILSASAVAKMTKNQVGALSAGKMKTARPERSSDVDFHPGFTDGFGFGFLINSTAYAGGRSAGSLAWAGLQNTFYWIDPHRGLCAVILMQFLPFCDSQAMAMLREFEHAVYA